MEQNPSNTNNNPINNPNTKNNTSLSSSNNPVDNSKNNIKTPEVDNSKSNIQAPENNKLTTVENELTSINTILQDLNSIKEQLTKIPLNPLQLSYFQNSVIPLLTTIENLSTTSFNLASSANLLSTSIITHAKKSKIKDTIHLVYAINDDCDDIYKVLRRRVDTLLYLEEKK